MNDFVSLVKYGTTGKRNTAANSISYLVYSMFAVELFSHPLLSNEVITSFDITGRDWISISEELVYADLFCPRSDWRRNIFLDW